MVGLSCRLVLRERGVLVGMSVKGKWFWNKVLEGLDTRTVGIMRNGIRFSGVFCLVAVFILSFYCRWGDPLAFYVGISLLKSGFFYLVMFLICGVAFNRIVNEVK